ncbi:MAG: hemerythrin domain-containing protein, partial [Rhodocyclaceae bacterium]|nr:hemerythrin domain-containing protein [Rhodocyclaceae bacterium]
MTAASFLTAVKVGRRSWRGESRYDQPFDPIMNNPTQPLQQHHKHCDDLFATAEARAHALDWPACQEASEKFLGELEAHFATEEQVLFPAFEAATGMSGGPTQVMRMEHAQMRELMAQMGAALKQRDRDAFAGVADTLLIMMQQHNMKEE